jgi:hypothetical protein
MSRKKQKLAKPLASKILNLLEGVKGKCKFFLPFHKGAGEIR